MACLLHYSSKVLHASLWHESETCMKFCAGLQLVLSTEAGGVRERSCCRLTLLTSAQVCAISCSSASCRLLVRQGRILACAAAIPRHLRDLRKRPLILTPLYVQSALLTSCMPLTCGAWARAGHGRPGHLKDAAHREELINELLGLRGSTVNCLH